MVKAQPLLAGLQKGLSFHVKSQVYNHIQLFQQEVIHSVTRGHRQGVQNAITLFLASGQKIAFDMIKTKPFPKESFGKQKLIIRFKYLFRVCLTK